MLDVAGGAIWRFPQLADGTLLEPQLAITRTDLSAAGSLAVGDSLFVAGSDGRIRRFSDGADQGFPLLDLDRPLLVPDSLAVGALTGLVYTVDRGNNRVAVFSAAGRVGRAVARRRTQRRARRRAGRAQRPALLRHRRPAAQFGAAADHRQLIRHEAPFIGWGQQAGNVKRGP